MKDTLTGRKLSQEHKDNISKANTGRIFSQETKDKIKASWVHRRLKKEEE
jgi:hypothetical protein